MKRVFVVLLVCLLAACTNTPAQPLVIVATPDAPDAGFLTYEHPSGVFTIRVPPEWIPDLLPDDNGLRMQFTSIEGSKREVRLTIYIVNVGQPLTAEAFLQAVNAYQPPADLSEIPWIPEGDPMPMTDGSVRLAGVRQYPMLGSRALNIFLQGNGSYFSALEIDVTDAPSELIKTLMAAVNTYRINPAMPLKAGSIEAGGTTSEAGVIGFQNYAHWQALDGTFRITGEVVNLTDNPLEAIRLTAYLYDINGNQLAESSEILPYDVLAGKQAAPFKIEFDTGRPSTAVRYELHAAARNAEFALSNFYAKENFLVINHSANYDNNGYLIIDGVLVNNGTKLANTIKVIVTVYNETKQVIAVESSFLTNPQLLPGETAPFEITIYNRGGNALSYEIIAQGISQ